MDDEGTQSFIFCRISVQFERDIVKALESDKGIYRFINNKSELTRQAIKEFLDRHPV